MAIEFEAEGVGGNLLAGCGKMKDDEAVGVAPGFLFGGADGEEQFVAGEFVALLEFFEARPVGSQAFFAAWHSPCCGAGDCGPRRRVLRRGAGV